MCVCVCAGTGTHIDRISHTSHLTPLAAALADGEVLGVSSHTQTHTDAHRRTQTHTDAHRGKG